MKKSSNILVCFVLFLVACNQPKDTINPLQNSDSLAVFLTELHFLESMVNNKYIKSNEAAIYYNRLFEEHNVTASQFDEALEWYEKYLECNPDPYFAQELEYLKSIPGLLPPPNALPEGCRFHPRCEHCMEICRHQAPEQYYDREGHYVACHLMANRKEEKHG